MAPYDNHSDEENDDEEMEDVDDVEHEQDGEDMDAGGDASDEQDDGDEDNDEQNEDDDEEGAPHSDLPNGTQDAEADAGPAPSASLEPTKPFTHASPRTTHTAYYPAMRPEALTAAAYDIVPTMAAPQSTSINAIAATPDMRWVFSGGTDGYVRMFNWADTANGKVPLTVAQKHPFVDSVMKAGALVTYWENEEPGSSMRTPPASSGEAKWVSPVYSLAVQHQALWLLSGLESGGINLQTCRHQAGTRITTLRQHTSAVSVLSLADDETSVLSGSWDKTILDWDLHTGQVKRSFSGSGSQISSLEPRPESNLAVPEVSEPISELPNGTFSSNNADKPLANGHTFTNGAGRRDTLPQGGDENALGSPAGSDLFGDDHGSLFGEDAGGGSGGGNTFGDDGDGLTRALENEMQDTEQDAPGEAEDSGTTGIVSGRPVQPPESPRPHADLPNGTTTTLPHTKEPLTAPPTSDSQHPTTSPSTSSASTFLSTSIDGVIRIWDRRTAHPVAILPPQPGTPAWATGACWSPYGDHIYIGRRNCTVDEYSLASLTRTPTRTFRFQAGSGPVYAVRAMPNGRELVCASHDILRVHSLDVAPPGRARGAPPFTIVPGHRGGVISAVWVDPTCRFMLSAAGNRGWEGGGTEVLLGYEIGVVSGV